MQDAIRSVVYVSRAMRHVPLADLDQLLVHARAANKAADISGVLLYHDGLFLQLIEGAPHAIDALLRKIAADRRHEAVMVLVDSVQVRTRMFPDWKMGFDHLSSIEPLIGPGLIENAARDMDDAIRSVRPDDPAAVLMAAVWSANRHHFDRAALRSP